MNYIELINQFWSCHKENCFSPSEVALYFHLLNTANSLKWKNPFREGNQFVCASLGISEPTLQRSRDRLVKAGLIDFKSGKVKRELTEYVLKDLGKNILYQSSTLSDTQSSTLSDTQNDVDGLDNIKLNQTKQKKVVKSQKPKSLHVKCKQLFSEKYSQLFDTEPYLAAKDAKAMNSIISKLEFSMKSKNIEITDDSIQNSWKFLLDSINDKWILEHFSLTIIDSKFNEIIAAIKASRVSSKSNQSRPDYTNLKQKNISILTGNGQQDSSQK